MIIVQTSLGLYSPFLLEGPCCHRRPAPVFGQPGPRGAGGLPGPAQGCLWSFPTKAFRKLCKALPVRTLQGRTLQGTSRHFADITGPRGGHRGAARRRAGPYDRRLTVAAYTKFERRAHSH